QYFKGEAKVDITFSDAIMPYLTQLKGQFTRVVVKNVSSLSSTHNNLLRCVQAPALRLQAL
ncbi:RepB family plasmid replication initiator protein, partial [Escherichia coli]|uniref:RepB family plasmid replication initiator protein n=1 Tax=Escherichia coli TaxID=562 RepID=UPI003EE1D2BB